MTNIRHQIRLSPEQSQALEAIASQKSVSRSEVVRRALDLYMHTGVDLEVPAIAELIAQLHRALAEARAEMDVGMRELAQLRTERDVDRQEVAAEALKWTQAHPDAVEALGRWLSV